MTAAVIQLLHTVKMALQHIREATSFCNLVLQLASAYSNPGRLSKSFWRMSCHRWQGVYPPFVKRENENIHRLVLALFTILIIGEEESQDCGSHIISQPRKMQHGDRILVSCVFECVGVYKCHGYKERCLSPTVFLAR